MWLPDIFVRVYLYALIISSIAFPLAYAVIWLTQPKRTQSLVRAKILVRNFLFLINGLVGLYVFSVRLFRNWIVIALMAVTLLGSVYLTEGIGKLLAKRLQRHDAT